MNLHCEGRFLLAGVEVADSWWQRLKGLLAGKALQRGGRSALWLHPCASVHTFGMGYALDIVFLDRTGYVLSVRENVPAWRACAQRGAKSTLELRAGSARALGIQPGQRLHLETGT